MSVKYQCPKCNRRFSDWGAEKLGFKCPGDDACPDGAEDEVIELVKMGSTEERLARKTTTMKRVPRRALAGTGSAKEDSASGDLSEFEDDGAGGTSGGGDDLAFAEDVAGGDLNKGKPKGIKASDTSESDDD